jgi:sRNA-binding protein
MKAMVAVCLCVLLGVGASPARGDFKYSDTAKITGGTLKSMMKTVGLFSKQASQAMKPMTQTHYVKGNFMRSDDAEGKVQIIDLGGRRILEIDPQKRSYAEITFEEMKAAMQRTQERAQQKDSEVKPKSKPASDSKADAKANINAKVTTTPGTASRQIQGLNANEMKMQIDMVIQAQQQNGQGTQGSSANSGTITTSIDSWVAPAVPGYEEIADFYQRMAKEISWVPPSNIRVDPRVTQSMDEVQKNSTALKGLPLLQYLSMTMAGQNGTGDSSADANNSGANGSSSDTPTNASDATMKGLGGLFNKKKKKDESAGEQSNSQNPPPPSTPGALIEMTI